MNGLGATSAMNGIQTSLRAFDRSAAIVAQATTAPDGATTGPDLVDGIVGANLAAVGVKANVAVLRTADEMLGTLLDLHA
jgi:hypothetical protein